MRFNQPLTIEDPRFSYYPPLHAQAPLSTADQPSSPPLSPIASTKTAPSWEPTLEKAIKAIVSIKASHVRSFDTETSGPYTATGFVIDAEQGILLTNRHVVSPAPMVAQGVLCNYEEVPVWPVYRDPVHDFGFLRFDPSRVRFMKLESIPLRPDLARVGLEIRVVGNDAGEKLSILAGTLARLDRQAPMYGVGEYTDFNTFYLQAASGTSGGSSGSPVLDIMGNAVALNAGGATQASSSYYLPLDRVRRALRYIQNGDPVPRGTLQTEWIHTPYDELRRLGLPRSLEGSIRQSDSGNGQTGLLVVRHVLPKGPAHGKLHEGDIILRVNGELITNFLGLFQILDNSVGQLLTVRVCRAGGLIDEVEGVTVQDLHSITPDRFVEVGGGVVHDLSYQMARGYGRPVEGVYVATSGHMLGSASAWRGSLITSINHTPTPDLKGFIHAVSLLPDGARVPVRFYSLAKAYKERVMIMHVDRHWHKFRLAIRNDKTGLWDYTQLPPAPNVMSYKPATAAFPKCSRKPASILQPSLCSIDFHIPYLIDGMDKTQFYGTGIIVDKERGLIVCDRDTVPTGVGDIFLTFANSVVIPGRLVWLDPVYNFVVCSYDPRLLGETPIQTAKLQAGKRMVPGDSTYLVGLATDYSVAMRKTQVSTTGIIGTREASPPRWRAVNVEGIRVEDPISTQGGVLCDEEGAVQALWVNYSTQNDRGEDVSFMAGLDITHFLPVLRILQKGKRTSLASLDNPSAGGGVMEVRALTGVELWTMRLSAARTLGLTERWTREVEGRGEGEHHTLLYVLHLTGADEPSSRVLRIGDIILQVAGKLVTSVRDLMEEASHTTQLPVTLWREGQEIEEIVPTTRITGKETCRVIGWAGALLQAPYHAVMAQVEKVPNQVYVSCTLYGSPSSSYGLRPGVWVTHVDGEPVENLEDFIQAIRRQEQRLLARMPPEKAEKEEEWAEEENFIRLTTVNRGGITRVLSLRGDPWYWGAWQLVPDAGTVSGWVCEEL
ncbi:hypothetical protein BJ684DRAFT_9380 [Piptocephalis cylindrospora]|uniref:PDZ domain-containing protein n=1 Tax=Piptocephalis cylindrospora TaxID=1907219 RepID=A0A4P9Y4L7_9FUNG|nr:hypothetical protein BJ684DRAFT_9380 [Piptocephalis cylindrospora]|eukprot:RKP13918.1 hypothetical protein BJ684DRAFT_9380 [Piptocephalis cylindrospora]